MVAAPLLGMGAGVVSTDLGGPLVPCATDADVLLLQEMDAEGTRRVAAALGLSWVYRPAIHHRVTGRDFGEPALAERHLTEQAEGLPRVADEGAGQPRDGAQIEQQLASELVDEATGDLTWDVPQGASSGRGNVAPPTLGEDSWKWLYVQPMLSNR